MTRRTENLDDILAQRRSTRLEWFHADWKRMVRRLCHHRAKTTTQVGFPVTMKLL
jgi:hypothetical protein